MNLRALCLVVLLPLLAASAQQPVPKQPIHGLVTMGSLKFLRHGGEPGGATVEANAHPGVYSAVVINVLWSQLEPQRGKFNHAVIEKGLADIRAHNKAHPQDAVDRKLRVNSGAKSPEWAMNIDGRPITLHDKDGDAIVPHFWSDNYRAAWRELQHDLASRYDSDPLVQEVGMSSCSSVTDEPFILRNDAFSIAALKAAGFTDSKERHCLMTVWQDYADWKFTPLDYTFNPYTDRERHAIADRAFTPSVMRAFRNALGPRAVLGNHGLQETPKESSQEVYDELKALGPPVEFQTVSPVVGWDASIAVGLRYGATEIEIWETKDAGSIAVISEAQLRRWAAAMRAQ